MKTPPLIPGALLTLLIAAHTHAQTLLPPDPARGKTLFQQSCAICHADTLGPGNTIITKQGPSLIGLLGRPAASSPGFNYSQALKQSRLTWSPATLDSFLVNPQLDVPGTLMPMVVPGAQQRADLIAYLATLILPAHFSATAQSRYANVPSDPGDWQHAAPGVTHHITVADLPPPYATHSAGNNPKIVKPPANATLAILPGFTVRPFATGLKNPRIIRVAPNGDIFIAETAPGRILILRAQDGAAAPAQSQVFASGLDRPFGIAFYPPGPDPQWVYIANNNSIVRFPYHSGDLQPAGQPQTIVPQLAPQSNGGHTTRDIAFSLDGRRMFITVGSSSNIADTMSKKDPAAIQQWEAQHGLGAAWDNETNRANILVTDPQGAQPLRAYATGIRNGAGITVNPDTGDLWASTNERDALGDNLVPDYVTRVKQGAFYGWPWYYLGSHEDPRHARERPDLAGHVTIPDVLFQSHTAPLEMCFYTASTGPAAFPAAFVGDAFVTSHGSWNRTSRTGYKLIRVHLSHGIPTGQYDDFLTGFVIDNRTVWGRPVGIAQAHDGALLMTDDGSNTLWRISYNNH